MRRFAAALLAHAATAHSILFQRGVYPPESFTRVQKYGLGLFVTQNDELQAYIASVLAQTQSKRALVEIQIFEKKKTTKFEIERRGN